MLALAVAHVGCAQLPRLPPPPSEDLRARLGAIAVVAGRFVPEADFRRPAKGEAAWRNSGRWAGEWATAGAVRPHLLTPILIVVGTPFAAGAGAIAGAVKGPSRADVDAFETALKAAFADLSVQDMVRDSISDAALQAGVRMVVFPDHGPRNPDNEDGNYRDLGPRAVDTVLEVSVSSLDMVGDAAYDPPALLIDLRTRLVRVADGTALYTHRMRYRSPSRAMDAWITGGGQRFRDEMTRACRMLADKIVEEVFLRVVVR